MRGFLLLALLFIGPVVGQEPTPVIEPPPGVLEEPIRIVAPDVVPDRMPADIQVEVIGDAPAILYVFEARSATAERPSGLDEDVTTQRTREARGVNNWTLYGQPGVYKLLAISYVADKPVSATVEIRVGPAVPVVNPPVVDPVVTPVNPGRRLVFVFWETNDPNLTNPQRALMARFQGEIIQPNGEVETYERQKNHDIQMLDDDDVAPQVQPWLQAGKAKFPNKPFVVIVDPNRISASDAGVLEIAEIPWPPTGKALLELIKKNGG